MTAKHDDLLAELAVAASAPWAIATDRAAAVTGIIADAATGRDVAPGRFRALLPTPQKQARDGGVTIAHGPAGKGDIAVVRVAGIALYNLEFYPFAFSTRLLASRMAELAADRSIGRIVIDFATPGGVVTGTPEAADAIFAARRVKPVTAAINPLAASAGYWLASQATEIAITQSGDTGSIGVFMLHIDLSSALKREGIKPTFIFAGERKIDGNAFQPLSARARDDLQQEVNTTYEDFIAAVARGRDVPQTLVRQRFGQGRVMSAREALSAGMVDRIATVEQVVTASPAVRGRRADASAQQVKNRNSRRRRLALLRHG